jgi:hypothetical protein
MSEANSATSWASLDILHTHGRWVEEGGRQSSNCPYKFGPRKPFIASRYKMISAEKFKQSAIK